MTVAHQGKNCAALLQRAREVNLKLNKNILTTEGLLPDPEKIMAVLNMQTPTAVKAQQWLLGFVNFLQYFLAIFLPHLSDVCEPLRLLTD